MGVYTPAVRTNKKHQSQRLWCKHLYALAYAPAGKPPKRDGTEYPDLVCGLSSVLSAKPSPLPRVTGAPAPIGKNIHLTVPFLRRGFTPRFSVSAFADRVPYANIHFAYDYEPFRTICQAVHTKKAKAKTLLPRCSKFPSKPLPFHQNVL